MMPRRRRLAIGAFVAVVVLLVGGRLTAEFVEDLLWYQTLEMERVFWTQWISATVVRFILGAVFALILFVNLSLVSRTLGTIRVRRRFANIEIAERLPNSYILAALLLISGLSGWWLSAGVTDPLAVLAAVRHAGWGLRDPYFGLDASFYVFVLPILDQLQTLFGLLVVWTAILVASAYAVTGALKVSGGQLQISAAARRHLGVLAGGFLLIVAWDLWLDRYGLLLAGTGVGDSVGYTDAHARQPALFLMALLAIGTAAGVAIGLWRDQRHIALISLALLAAGGVLARIVVPALMQKLVVEPNEVGRESPYIVQHIDFTRRAYQLDDIEIVRLPYRDSVELTEADVTQALAGAPLWDPRPLHTTFNEKESLYGYYAFASVHADRYEGEQVAIAVRELDVDGLTPETRTWQNLHLRYVSGQGAVVTPMAEMAGDGSPVYYLRDLSPPTLAAQAPASLELTEPEVFFGERTGGYVVVDPDEAPAGVPLTSFWRKLVFAWAFQSRNLLLSGSVTPGSKVVYRRSVVERVGRVAPFLRFLPERGIQPVIHQGHIVWLVDGYTATSSFPLSRRAPLDALPVRYARNSVKATVDGLTGEVRLYVVDPSDPILRTYASFFPGLLQPLSDMPPALRGHLRVPAALLDLQSTILWEYHIRDPARFYAREDVWTTSTEIYRAEEQSVGASYAMLTLPGESEREFLLTVPLSARGRPNLAALLVARNDQPHYGQRVLYELPRDEFVPGPQQIEATIDQNPEISQQLSLWKEGGSQVIRGRILVVPVDSTLVYMEPLFLEADQAATPQLERVILAGPGAVVMRATLEAAVAALVSGGPESTPARPTAPRDTAAAGATAAEAVLSRLRSLMDDAEAELRAGDWAGFGESWRALRELLRDAPRPPQP
ncbi:MAG TPA: UPF0182 family protein [Longimicrobiaceae bacterium]